MLVYDREENCCAAYEIKHSRQIAPEQARHLRDAEKCALTEQRFGKLVGKYVLYIGESQDSADGILYRNAEEFLKGLPSIQLRMDRAPSDRSDPRRT